MYLTYPRLPLARLITCGAAAAISVCHSASAQSINWGNTLLSTNVDSVGSALNNANYTYQFGIFLNGFNPTVANIADWDNNWLALDTSSYNDGTALFQDSWTEAPGADPDEVDPTNPPPPVLQSEIEGEQAYIWIFNNQNGDTSSEYGLFTNPTDWIVPTFDGSQETLSEDWRIAPSDPSPDVLEANTIIFGGMNSVQGAGEFDAGGTPATFDLQTHRVPEPKLSLLLGVAGLLLIFRRRR